jgi:predicted flavoprotein YhiN
MLEIKDKNNKELLTTLTEVSRSGVLTDELDANTLESKKVKNSIL